jgi:hypothetical protein
MHCECINFNDLNGTISRLVLYCSPLPSFWTSCVSSFMIRSDIVIKASGEMSSEAGDFTPFSTVVAQGVSPTVKKLVWLPSMDAEW